jgi:hypothetical protein
MAGAEIDTNRQEIHFRLRATILDYLGASFV